MKHRIAETAAMFSVGAGVAMASYPLWRQWCLTWGATADEVLRTMPGDELLESADLVTTRAITIQAAPAAIWPWLVQMGPGRGGAYTYDWIENLLGLGMHSANEILPEFQSLKVGDTQRLGRTGPRLEVAILDAERGLVLRSDDGNWVWAFGLYPSDGSTRLVSRNRIAVPDASAYARLAYTMIMEPGSLVMERKMLLGIKSRAENMANTELGCGASVDPGTVALQA